MFENRIFLYDWTHDIRNPIVRPMQCNTMRTAMNQIIAEHQGKLVEFTPVKDRRGHELVFVDGEFCYSLSPSETLPETPPILSPKEKFERLFNN